MGKQTMRSENFPFAVIYVGSAATYLKITTIYVFLEKILYCTKIIIKRHTDLHWPKVSYGLHKLLYKLLMIVLKALENTLFNWNLDVFCQKKHICDFHYNLWPTDNKLF